MEDIDSFKSVHARINRDTATKYPLNTCGDIASPDREKKYEGLDPSLVARNSIRAPETRLGGRNKFAIENGRVLKGADDYQVGITPASAIKRWS